MTLSARSARDLVAASALTGWLVLTGLSQHPNRAFDRYRSLDRTGTLIPNWRFFAPEPAVHDYRVLHRHVDDDGQVSPWRETTALAARLSRQAIWFPDRRRDKAVSDICNEIITQIAAEVDVTRLPCYQVLREHVADVLRREFAAREAAPPNPPRGFQFIVARSAGYDESHEPEYLFASAYEKYPHGAVA